MREGELLRTIEIPWLSTAKKRVSYDSDSSRAVGEQLRLFFDGLVQSVDHGDPSCLYPVLDAWCAGQTESELEGQPSSVITFLKEIMEVTNQVSNDVLPADDADSLNSALIPIYAHAFETAAQRITDARVAHAAGRLDAIRKNLERLDRSKSDFISVAAHELKTPLTLIEGYTAMLREALGERSNDQVEATLLQGIEQGSKRLQAMINDMIDVSRIDNSLLSLNFQPVWVDRLFKRLAAELEGQLAERSISLNQGSFDGFGDMTYGDPERLTQAFRHVLVNAVKYTPDGGRISIDGQKLPGFLEIRVSDTGIGIAPEDQAHIFEKFYRSGSPALHSSGKTKFKGGGPGLGLPITRGILEAHGGSVWVESPGHDEESCPGTVFHLLLPLRPDPPDPAAHRLFRTSTSQISIYPT